MTHETHARRRPGRERLLRAMDKVLYRDGVRSTSVDALLAEAGVARGTLYNNFTTRDELLDAYLRERHQATLSSLSSIAASGTSLSEKVDAIFDHLSRLVEEDVFRGCAFVVAAAELPDEARPPRQWARRHKEEVRNLIEVMVGPAYASQAGVFADQLSILYDGALVAAFLRPSSNAVETARDMAKELLRGAGVEPRR